MSKEKSTKSAIEKLLEQKRNKSSSQNNRTAKPIGEIGEQRKAVNKKFGGGMFDGKKSSN